MIDKEFWKSIVVRWVKISNNDRMRKYIEQVETEEYVQNDLKKYLEEEEDD